MAYRAGLALLKQSAAAVAAEKASASKEQAALSTNHGSRDQFHFTKTSRLITHFLDNT